MPAPAEPEAQEECQAEPREPRLAEAQAGPRVVGLREAAPGVAAPGLALVWWCTRVLGKAPSGRPRLHGLAAWPATTQAIVTVQHLTDVTAEPVCAWRRRLAGASPAWPITIVRDQARDHQGALVPDLARSLGLEWGEWPAYAPHLHRSERCGTWVKQPGLYGTYAPTSADCQAAIQPGMAPAHRDHLAALERFWTLQCQTCTAVPVRGEEAQVDSSAGEQQQQAQVSLFPKRTQAQKQVSSKAA